MFRARQLSHLLNTLSTQTVCANKYLDKHQAASLSKVISTSRFYSSKSDGPKQVPSIKDCPHNLMSDTPPPTADDCDDRSNKSRYRALLWGLLFSAVTLGGAYYGGLIKPAEPKRETCKPVPKESSRKPASSALIPKKVPYLLIGGGTASFSAFRAIKSSEPTAKVLVVTEENYYPYMRPPLSKEIWYNDDSDSAKKLIFKQWNGSERSLFYEPDDFYIDCENLMDSANGGVAVARGWKITHLDVRARKAYLEDGAAIEYDKCLIATGAKTKKMPVFETAIEYDHHVKDRVKYYRNINDFEEVDKVFKKSKSIAIIGGGFLGSELACALARKEKDSKREIFQIFREPGNMGKILPEYLSYWTTNKVNAEGVNVMTATEIISVRSRGEKGITLNLNTGKSLDVDYAIVAIGAEPNTDFAEKSDLEVDPDFGGYLVNTELQARSHLYIAGDCSCFYDPLLGRRRIEHHDHAVVSGRLAGENMTGASKPYVHQSMFWSDLGPDVGYEAIGIVDSSLPTVGVFAKATLEDNPQAAVTATGEADRSKMEEEPKNCNKHLTERQAAELRENTPRKQDGEDFGKGVIFYLRDDVVVGIVLWNVFNRMATARQVLKAQNKYDDLNEVAKLFKIHEE
ncbi:apoptosis-inducing factor 1, mitochondrial isoform X2 [Aethina tumida]|uniref:apoptosis-inducing factor 1, mitochondrial isoform X2 n=1 Tax=Aethina tumida TaxID=116153 RepID=UPI0021488859|nr:apoptosis-inducing factor 1, mitochondrial isoform X2 [Aethina tumida]